jgi:uncharacterized membrane protein
MKRLSLALLSTTIALACQGCMVLSSDGVTKRQPTVGEQLIDLKSAYEKGAISTDEYEKKKTELLRHPV